LCVKIEIISTKVNNENKVFRCYVIPTNHILIDGNCFVKADL